MPEALKAALDRLASLRGYASVDWVLAHNAWRYKAPRPFKWWLK